METRKDFNRKVAKAAQSSQRKSQMLFLAAFANSSRALRLKAFALKGSSVD